MLSDSRELLISLNSASSFARNKHGPHQSIELIFPAASSSRRFCRKIPITLAAHKWPISGAIAYAFVSPCWDVNSSGKIQGKDGICSGQEYTTGGKIDWPRKPPQETVPEAAAVVPTSVTKQIQPERT